MVVLHFHFAIPTTAVSATKTPSTQFTNNASTRTQCRTEFSEGVLWCVESYSIDHVNDTYLNVRPRALLFLLWIAKMGRTRETRVRSPHARRAGRACRRCSLHASLVFLPNT